MPWAPRTAPKRPPAGLLRGWALAGQDLAGRAAGQPPDRHADVRPAGDALDRDAVELVAAILVDGDQVLGALDDHGDQQIPELRVAPGHLPDLGHGGVLGLLLQVRVPLRDTLLPDVLGGPALQQSRAFAQGSPQLRQAPLRGRGVHVRQERRVRLRALRRRPIPRLLHRGSSRQAPRPSMLSRTTLAPNAAC
jgi:hypothetical protein